MIYCSIDFIFSNFIPSKTTRVRVTQEVKVIGILAGIVLVLYFGISVYLASMIEVPRIPLGESPASVGLVYEDVSFPSHTDNITLRGWYMPGEKEFAIIMVSGGIQNRVDPNAGTLEMGKNLVERGFSVLMFDLRGRGESEGKGVFLTHDERDIRGAVDYIKNRGYPADSIGVIGFSTGATSSLIFASHENIAAVISDSSFADVTEDLVRKVSIETGIPKLLVKLFVPSTLLMVKMMYGYDTVNLMDTVADVRCPILFIYGELDDLVPMESAYKLFEASGNPLDELWVVPGAGHSQTYKMNPVSYIDKVTAFFE